jgi:phenylalanyl-tRNA synthetase alpha subunit
MYALLNEASTSRKLLTKQLHALESMKKGIEQKHDKDDHDKTELSEIETTIYQNKRLLKNPPDHVDMAEQDTTIHNMNRYMSTKKLIQSLRNKYQKKL